MEFDDLFNRIIDCAIEVDRTLLMNFNVSMLKEGIRRFVL